MKISSIHTVAAVVLSALMSHQASAWGYPGGYIPPGENEWCTPNFPGAPPLPAGATKEMVTVWNRQFVDVPREEHWQDWQQPPFQEWRELKFDGRTSGRTLVFQASGRVSVEWVQLFFSDGTSQVLDVQCGTLSNSIFGLWNIGQIRQVDHVAVMVRSVYPATTVRISIA